MCKAFSTNTNTTQPTSGGVSSVGGDRHFNNGFPGDIRRACVGQWCPRNLGFAGTVARIRFTVTESVGLASFRTLSSEVSLTLLKFASLGENDGKSKHICLLPNLQQPPGEFIYDSYFQFPSPEVPPLPILFQCPL